MFSTVVTKPKHQTFHLCYAQSLHFHHHPSQCCGGDEPAQIKDNLPRRLNVIIQNWSTGQRLLNMYMTSFTSSQIKIFYEFSVVIMESIKYTID